MLMYPVDVTATVSASATVILLICDVVTRPMAKKAEAPDSPTVAACDAPTTPVAVVALCPVIDTLESGAAAPSIAEIEAPASGSEIAGWGAFVAAPASRLPRYTPPPTWEPTVPAVVAAVIPDSAIEAVAVVPITPGMRVAINPGNKWDAFTGAVGADEATAEEPASATAGPAVTVPGRRVTVLLELVTLAAMENAPLANVATLVESAIPAPCPAIALGMTPHPTPASAMVVPEMLEPGMADPTAP